MMTPTVPIPPPLSLFSAVSEGDENELEDRALEDDRGRLLDGRSEAVVGNGLAGDDAIAGDEVCCRPFDEELENLGVGSAINNELERYW